MIVQSNIAQPQIIQRQPKFDMFLARLLALAQMGGEAAKSYNYYTAAQNANRPDLESLRYAVQSLPSENGVLQAFLRMRGVPEEQIQQMAAIKDRYANNAYRHAQALEQEAQKTGQNPLLSPAYRSIVTGTNEAQVPQAQQGTQTYSTQQAQPPVSPIISPSNLYSSPTELVPNATLSVLSDVPRSSGSTYYSPTEDFVNLLVNTRVSPGGFKL